MRPTKACPVVLRESETVLTKRLPTPQDLEFLRELHHAAYRDVVTRQFGAWDEQRQDESFMSDLAGARFQILLIDEVPIGAVGLDESDVCIRLAELWILPAYQGRGLGASILRGLQERARQAGMALTLSVLKANRARALYERHGFVVVGETDTVYRMEWKH